MTAPELLTHLGEPDAVKLSQDILQRANQLPNVEAAVDYHEARWRKAEGHWPHYHAHHEADGWHGVIDDYDPTRGYTHVEHTEASWDELAAWMRRHRRVMEGTR